MFQLFINCNRFVIDFDKNNSRAFKKNRYLNKLFYLQKKSFSSFDKGFFDTTLRINKEVVGNDKHSKPGMFDFFDLVSTRTLRKFRLKTKARGYFNASSIFSNFCLDRKFKRLDYGYFVNELKNTFRYFFLRSFKKPPLLSSRYRFKRKRFLKRKPFFKKIKKKLPFFKLGSAYSKRAKHKKFKSKKKALRLVENKKIRLHSHKIKLSRSLNRKKIKKLKTIKRQRALKRYAATLKSKNHFFRKRRLRFNKRKRLKKNDFISKLKKYNFRRKKNEYKRKRKIKKKIRKTYAFSNLMFKKNSLKFVRHLLLNLGKRLQILPRKNIINFSFLINKSFSHLPDYYNYTYIYLVTFRKFNLNLQLLSKYFKIIELPTISGKSFKSYRKQLLFPKTFLFSTNLSSNKSLLNFYIFHSRNLFLMEKYKFHFLLSYFLRKKNKGFFDNLKTYFMSSSNRKNFGKFIVKKFGKLVKKKRRAFLSFFTSNNKNYKPNAKHLSSGLDYTYLRHTSQFKLVRLPLKYHFKRSILNGIGGSFFKKRRLKKKVTIYSWYQDLRFRRRISIFIFEKYWKNFLRLRNLFKNLDFFFLISYFLQKLSNYNLISLIPRIVFSVNIFFFKSLFILSMSNNFILNFLQSNFNTPESSSPSLIEKNLDLKINPNASKIEDYDNIYEEWEGFMHFFSYRSQLINNIFIKKNLLKFRYCSFKSILFQGVGPKELCFFLYPFCNLNAKKKYFSFRFLLDRVRKIFSIEKDLRFFKIKDNSYFKKCSSFVFKILSSKLHTKTFGQCNFEGFIKSQRKITHLKEKCLKNINVNFFKKNSEIIFEKLKLNFGLFINGSSFFQILRNSLLIDSEKNFLISESQNINNFGVRRKKLGKRLKFFRFYRISKKKKRRRFFSKIKIYRIRYKNEERNRIEHDFSSYENFYKRDEEFSDFEKSTEIGGEEKPLILVEKNKNYDEHQMQNKNFDPIIDNDMLNCNFLQTVLTAINSVFYLGDFLKSVLKKKKFFSKRKIKKEMYKENAFIKKYKEKLVGPHIQSYFLGRENYKKIDYFRNSENYFFARFNFQEREVSVITQYVYYFFTKSFLKKNSIYNKITYLPNRRGRFYHIDKSTYNRVFYFKKDPLRKHKKKKIFITEETPELKRRPIFFENLRLKRSRYKKFRLTRRKKRRKKFKFKLRSKIFNVRLKKLARKKYIYIYLKSNPQNFFATIINRRGKLVGKTSGGLFGNRGPYRSTRHAALGNTKRMLKKFFLYRKRKVKNKRKKKNLKRKRKFIFKLKTLSRANRWKLLKKNKNKKYDYILNPRYRGGVVIFFRSPALKRQIKSALLGIMESKFHIIRAYSFLKVPHNGCKRFIPRRL